MEIKSLVNLVCNRAAKVSFVKNLCDSMDKWLPIYEMNQKLRLCAFLSQCAHETGGFIFLRELGGRDYCAKYEPGTKIGDELGNTEPGDGYKYKGHGIIQLSGRKNYALYGKLIGADLINNPDLLLIPDISVHLACEFWKQHQLNDLADKSDIASITKKINGGLNGLSERTRLYNILIKATDVNV